MCTYARALVDVYCVCMCVYKYSHIYHAADTTFKHVVEETEKETEIQTDQQTKQTDKQTKRQRDRRHDTFTMQRARCSSMLAKHAIDSSKPK